MHRFTARLLLLFALVAYFVPIATASTPHACCLRKRIHHCQDATGSEATELVIRGASCCRGDGCGVVATSRWAHPPAGVKTSFARDVEAYLGQSNAVAPVIEVSKFQSTRAPPAC